MAQTALDGVLHFPADTPVFISEVACTFQVIGSAPIEVVGTASVPATLGDRGYVYNPGKGEDASTDVFTRFGAGVNQLWGVSRGVAAVMRVNREATS